MFRIRILEWLWADYMLYDYFKTRFKSKLEAFGQQRMEEQKTILRDITDSTLVGCKEESFKNVCKYINKYENPFLKKLQQIQKQKSLKLLQS